MTTHTAAPKTAETAKAPKAAKPPKPPPAPWFEAFLILPLEGLPGFTKVYVRRAREGGWRVLSQTRQILLNEDGRKHYIAFLRDDAGHHRAAPTAKQGELNVHLANIFKGTTPVAYKGGKSTKAA